MSTRVTELEAMSPRMTELEAMSPRVTELELKNNELEAQMVEVIAMNDKLAARVRELEGAAKVNQKASTEAPIRGKEGLAAGTKEPRALNASDDSMATAVGSLRGGRQLSHAECACYNGNWHPRTFSGGFVGCYSGAHVVRPIGN